MDPFDLAYTILLLKEGLLGQRYSREEVKVLLDQLMGGAISREKKRGKR